MSGGIAQLVALGKQDNHLVGNPEISFFKSTYKRHTNFSQTVNKQVIQNVPKNNGSSTVCFEKSGDLLGYVYLTALNTSTNTVVSENWSNSIKRIQLLIGGQVVDTQDIGYIVNVSQLTTVNTFSKTRSAGYFDSTASSVFFPLKFSFCENVSSYLPLVALQYHNVELKIEWNTVTAGVTYECWANFIHLDNFERNKFSTEPHNMLITQVQTNTPSLNLNQELVFNHPVKFIASVLPSGTIAQSKLRLNINGTDVTNNKQIEPHFTKVTLYNNTSFASGGDIFFYPFCLDSNKFQPTGTLNFSRLDSAKFIIDGNSRFNGDIYAVNYNILKIEHGMGGVLYAN